MLKAKAHQFCYRFTWQYLLYLIMATVRSEAINSAVKTTSVSSKTHLLDTTRV
jgi:hypothetical protein